MKTFFVVVLLVAFAAGQSKPVPQARDYTSLFFDNINLTRAGEDFADAFALEPACSGLTITLWTAATSSDERDDAIRSAGWSITGPMTPGPVTTLFRSSAPQGEYAAKGGRNLTTSFSFEAKTDRAAARQVCFLMKKKGGKVK